MAKYDGECGTCREFFDKRGNCDKPYDTSYYEKGYCTWYKSYYYPDDSCNHYVKRGSSSTYCYITTIVCNILGFTDDCLELESLRSLRNDVLQKDEKYKGILYEYDTVGPEIAENLYLDYSKKQDKEFPTLLFNFYIQPSARLYREGHIEESISRYQEMTNALKECYGIEGPTEISESYDQTKGGHGKVKQKTLGTYFDALKAASKE